jgi:putative membrane protein
MSTGWLRKFSWASCFLLFFCLVIQPSSANERLDSFAAVSITKEETVYANLKGDGQVGEIYVVNAFPDQSGEIIDFGQYEEIINLTDNDKQLVEEGKIIFNPNKVPFYYQGKLAKGTELPWLFNIAYELNGKLIDAASLPGAEGHLKLLIEIKHNPNRESFYHDHYMLQVAVPLSLQHCMEIVAPGATKMVVGETAAYNFNVLAGEEGVFTIDADINNFAMGPIQIAAVKSELDLADLEGELTAGFSEMASGLGEMIDGTAQLKTGTVEINRGIGDLHTGVSKLNSAGSSLVEGMANYNLALNEFAAGAAEIRVGSRHIESSLSETAAGLQALLPNYGEIGEGLAAILEDKEQLAALASGLAQSPDPEVRALAAAMLAQLGGLEQVDAALRQANSGLGELRVGVDSLAEQYTAFDQGIEAFTDGSGPLLAGYGDLLDGVERTMGGVREIQGGTAVLKRETSAMPAALQGLLEGQKEMHSSIISTQNSILARTAHDNEVETVSFAAPGVITTGSVQFIMQTPAIEKTIEIQPPEEAAAEKLNIWQRLLNLF